MTEESNSGIKIALGIALLGVAGFAGYKYLQSKGIKLFGGDSGGSTGDHEIVGGGNPAGNLLGGAQPQELAPANITTNNYYGNDGNSGANKLTDTSTQSGSTYSKDAHYGLPPLTPDTKEALSNPTPQDLFNVVTGKIPVYVAGKLTGFYDTKKGQSVLANPVEKTVSNVLRTPPAIVVVAKAVKKFFGGK